MVLCVPHRDIACEDILEQEGVHGLLELRWEFGLASKDSVNLS